MGNTKAYEIDSEGHIVEVDTLTDEEIQTRRDEGRRIVTQGWHGQRLFTPIYDGEKWVEGLSADEVTAREKIIEEQRNKPSDEDLNAIALMELTSMVMGGE